MSSKDNIAEEIKRLAHEKGEDISDEQASLETDKLVGFFDLLWKCAKEDAIKKKRLKKEPNGFPVDGTYSCLICSNRIDHTNGWYDWFGQTCLTCYKAVKDGVIPTFIFQHRNSYFSISSLKYTFDIKHQTAKKYIKEGKLVPRIILNENGTPHEYIFLKKENPGLIERYSPERKSYDRSRAKRSNAWERKMKLELKAEHKKFMEERKKKYPNLYK
ncbi:MAG: hypothetical protein NTW98_02830 [Candidatus Nomurabacteria bacterium]|nr:hypothetical protein [Candidatus Nomurabacteria bacterium]